MLNPPILLAVFTVAIFKRTTTIQSLGCAAERLDPLASRRMLCHLTFHRPPGSFQLDSSTHAQYVVLFTFQLAIVITALQVKHFAMHNPTYSYICQQCCVSLCRKESVVHAFKGVEVGMYTFMGIVWVSVAAQAQIFGEGSVAAFRLIISQLASNLLAE